MEQESLINLVGLASLPVWMGGIAWLARSRGRHWAWGLLGLLQIVGLAFALAWFFWIKPGNKATDIRALYARGEIAEEEYLRAMTGKDRAA